jgi:hypothetical protein
VLVSARRDAAAARLFFRRVPVRFKVTPTEVVTDAAAVYPAILDELIPSAWHHVEQYANNRIEADHGQLKHRLRPMRGLHTDQTAQVIISGHAFVQNLRRGHYELGRGARPARRSPQRSPNSYTASNERPDHGCCRQRKRQRNRAITEVQEQRARIAVEPRPEPRHTPEGLTAEQIIALLDDILTALADADPATRPRSTDSSGYTFGPDTQTARAEIDLGARRWGLVRDRGGT